MKNALVFSQLEAREFFMYIITLVSCSLLGFSSLRWLGMHLVLFQGSLSLDYYVSISRTSTILFFGVLRQYLAHFQDSLSLDCYVSFARTFSILLHSKVTLISRAFQNRLIFDCYVSIVRTFRILFYWIVTLVSRAPHWFVTLVSCALLGLSYMRLLVSTTRRIGLGLLR